MVPEVGLTVAKVPHALSSGCPGRRCVRGTRPVESLKAFLRSQFSRLLPLLSARGGRLSPRQDRLLRRRTALLEQHDHPPWRPCLPTEAQSTLRVTGVHSCGWYTPVASPANAMATSRYRCIGRYQRQRGDEHAPCPQLVHRTTQRRLPWCPLLPSRHATAGVPGHLAPGHGNPGSSGVSGGAFPRATLPPHCIHSFLPPTTAKALS